MVVTKGYKRTEAGKIPNDWLAFPIGDLLTFEGGSQPDKRFFRHTWKQGYIRLVQIRDYKTDQYVTYIPKTLARRFCTTDDIMIGRYGPPIFQILKGISGAYNVALIKTIVQPNVSRKFCYYFLTRETLFRFIEKLSQRSSGQTGVDLVELKKYPIPLPPTLAEQEAIAGALSDADAWIESLEQLIAKKRQIKQGAMQELLTGKRRLPGFRGEWSTVLLGELITHCSSGATPFRGRGDYYQGSVRWITSGELNYNIIMDTIEHISQEAVANTNLKLHPPGTFLMAITGLEAAGTRGSCGIVGAAATTNQSCMAVYPNSRLTQKYLFHYYVYRGDELALKYCQGTKQQSYTAGLVRLLPIELPPTTDEQNSITEFLSSMDAEIELLECKLAKARQIKQGMMQELLTGRIRLV
ncbi:MAG: restriction endonuclease subunit S [Planctomycetaceae bacterium]|nr:restriction endonuclease subunit S [Planctomycetaceae bacterium]